jgi:hypothetical protein
MKFMTKLLLGWLALGLVSFSAWAQPAVVRFDPGHGESFWVTNNTDKRLWIELDEIEVLAGSQWKPYSQPYEPTPNYYGPRGGGELVFTHFGSIVGQSLPQSNCGWLAPHEAGYGHLSGSRRVEIPGYGVWRADLTVIEELTGQDRLDAAAKNEVYFKSYTNRTAVRHFTNILSNAAVANTFPIYWGHPQGVHSQEVQSL